MNLQEKIEKANVIRSRDRFGTMTAEELAALPGSEQVLRIPSFDHTVTVYELRPDDLPETGNALLINLHGGGFLKGRGDRDKRYCSELANDLKCLVWDVDYSLAPEHPFPTAVYECCDIAAYAFAHAEELGVDAKKIAIAGHSAGGTLAAATILLGQRIGLPAFCGALMEYFPSDFQTEPMEKLSEELAKDPWWIKRVQVEAEYTSYYLSCEEDRENPLCSPMCATAEELAGFPVSLIISAGKDTLQKECEQFAQKLIASGVTVIGKRIPEAMHGFTTNRTDGWEKALELHQSFFRHIFE